VESHYASVVATGPKIDGFLRLMIIHSTTSFGREVKPGVLCHRLQHVKEKPFTHDKRWVRAKKVTYHCGCTTAETSGRQEWEGHPTQLKYAR
jgi:hypothetical protein